MQLCLLNEFRKYRHEWSKNKHLIILAVNISNEHGTQEKMFLTVFQEPLAFVLQITKATRLSKAHRKSSKINTQLSSSEVRSDIHTLHL